MHLRGGRGEKIGQLEIKKPPAMIRSWCQIMTILGSCWSLNHRNLFHPRVSRPNITYGCVIKSLSCLGLYMCSLYANDAHMTTLRWISGSKVRSCHSKPPHSRQISKLCFMCRLYVAPQLIYLSHTCHWLHMWQKCGYQRCVSRDNKNGIKVYTVNVLQGMDTLTIQSIWCMPMCSWCCCIRN